MVTYEIYLTDCCNRNCNFCHILKTGYIETIANIEKFCKYIKDKHTDIDEDFNIHLFGGEPMLNVDGIKYIISRFYDYKCDICLITNGDLLTPNVFTDKELDRLKIQVTTYDFMKNKNFYYDFFYYVKNLTFTYTFSENDIDKLDDFYDFCKCKNINMHISFSHSNLSWKNIEKNSIYNTIYSFVKKTFDNAYEYNLMSSMFENDFNRVILLLFDYDNIKPILCIDNNTLVFYKGKFLESCIHLEKTDIVLSKCINCDYNKICTKTCLLSLIDGEVPEKLCSIKKAIYDAIIDFIRIHMNEDTMKNLIKKHYCDMFV